MESNEGIQCTQVRSGKQNLDKETGMLSIPDPRCGSFSKEPVAEVMTFYKSEIAM